jgi:hypothetical protein
MILIEVALSLNWTRISRSNVLQGFIATLSLIFKIWLWQGINFAELTHFEVSLDRCFVCLFTRDRLCQLCFWVHFILFKQSLIFLGRFWWDLNTLYLISFPIIITDFLNKSLALGRRFRLHFAYLTRSINLRSASCGQASHLVRHLLFLIPILLVVLLLSKYPINRVGIIVSSSLLSELHPFVKFILSQTLLTSF